VTAPSLAHARGLVAAVRSVFRHTCLIAEAAVVRDRTFDGLIVAAGDHELPVVGLIRQATSDPFRHLNSPAPAPATALARERSAGSWHCRAQSRTRRASPTWRRS
jgi:hypothetical protein